MSDLRFRLLGPLEVERGGIRLDLGPRKQRAVLALLLLEANRVVPSERLIDELWGDTPPETARSALQVYVSRLRKALGEDGASLRTQPPGYVLELEPGALDLQAFTALRAEARDASEPARAAEALHEALALWRGAPLAELDGAPFGTAAAAQLEEQRLGALEDRIDADLALGRHADLVHELDALVVAHPYRERFRAQQMLALYRSGRQADALAAYRSAREAFVEGLGIEPGAELKALERQVLDQDPALAAPAGEAAPPRAGPRRRRVRTAMLVGLAVATVAVVAALRDESAPPLAPPNSVAVIDPKLEPGHGGDRRRSTAGADRRRRRRGLDGQPRRQDAHAHRPGGSPRDRDDDARGDSHRSGGSVGRRLGCPRPHRPDLPGRSATRRHQPVRRGPHAPALRRRGRRAGIQSRSGPSSATRRWRA